MALSKVSDSYGQNKPTVSFKLLNDRHCETGTAKMQLTLTGHGVLEVGYRMKSDVQDYTSHANNLFGDVVEIPVEVSETTIITISAVYDENYPSGGDGGDIIGNATDTIIIDKTPTASISDPIDIKTCRRSITLDADPGTVYTKAYWEETAGGSFNDRNLRHATYTADTDGDYTLSYTVENGTCVSSAAKTFTIAYQNPPHAAISVADLTLCEGQSTTLNLNSITGRLPLTLNYSDGTNTIAHPFNADHGTILLSPAASTSYKMLSLVDRDGCDQPLSDEFEVHVDLVPTANAGIEINECDTLITLNAQIGNASLFTGKWMPVPGLNFDDATLPNANVWIPKHGQLPKQAYTLDWSVWNTDNPTCKDEAGVDIQFLKQPENVSAGNDTTLYLEEEMLLSAAGYEESMEGHWTVISDSNEKPQMEDESRFDTKVTNLRMGNNPLVWSVSNTERCISLSDTINIKVSGLMNPTGFSPNGDGINELFKIGGAKQVNNNKLIIFDITGKLIFSTENFCHPHSETPHGWNAIGSNGSAVKDGTYYYVFTGDNIEAVKNYVIIKRSR